MTIELCTNLEMIGQSVAWGDDNANDAAEKWLSIMSGRLADCGIEYTWPQGQRVLFHQWNGAHFDSRLACGLVGVFGAIDAATAAQIEACDDDARAAARELISAR